MRPNPPVLSLCTLLSALLLLCDTLETVNTHFQHDPYNNPDIRQAVNDFIQNWGHRHHQNVDYRLRIRRLGRETAPAPDQAQGALMTALTADDLPEGFRTNSDIIQPESGDSSGIPIIPEHMRPQIPQRGPLPTPVPPQQQCPTCNVSRETDKQLRIAMIQQQILKRLGLKEPPQVNVSEADLAQLEPLRSMLEHPYHRMYHEFGREEEEGEEYALGEEDKATVMKLISFGEPLPRELTRDRPYRQACQFNFAKDNTRARVIRAKLWVYLRPARMTLSNSTRIDIYKLGRPMYEDGPLSGSRVLHPARKITPRAGGGWHSFDLKEVVREWIVRPEEMYALQVEAVDNEGKDLPVMVPKNENELKFKPIIELRFTENRRRQKRRTDDHCDERQNITRCCLYPLTVDFAQMGWNFILNPRTYKANYCSGECPNVYKQNFQHTHIIQQAYAAKKPCCAPKSMKAVSFLYYYSNGNIVYGKVPDMSVESCTCV